MLIRYVPVRGFSPSNPMGAPAARPTSLDVYRRGAPVFVHVGGTRTIPVVHGGRYQDSPRPDGGA
jgi:hypothetical protein